MSEPLPFHRPSIWEQDVQAVADTLRSGWLTSGPKVLQFEKLFAEKVGSKYAVALNSCTAAIHLTLIALGVGPGDEVITSSITFASAVNVIEHVGATPIFVDVRHEDLTLDPQCVRRAITSKTKLIIVTYFAGRAAAMDEIFVAANGIPVIIDAAHAIETTYHGLLSGQLGRAVCYSFYVTKNMTTGEGGMLATDDVALAERARTLRLHGMTRDAWTRYVPGGYKHWDITEPGWKCNMTDVQAALGVSQLAHLDVWQALRSQLEKQYLSEITDPEVGLLRSPDRATNSARHLFVVLLRNRDRVMVAMQERGVGVGVHFRAVHRLKYYNEKYRIPAGTLPVAERASEEVLSLPLYPAMSDRDVDRVCDVLRGVLRDVKHNLC
jgi:dTDP-4-amino-4,6-dideoxygalactose transaminase